MKKIIKIYMVLISAVLITSIFSMNITIAQTQKAEITLKNKSASDANDVHITADANKKFKTGQAPGFNPSNKAPVGGSHTLDWPSSDNVTPIPPGGTIKIKVEFTDAIGGIKSDSCWLTYNGVPLTTGVTFLRVDAFKTSANSGNLKFTNTAAVPWLVTNCLLFVDNPVDPLDGPVFSPSVTPITIPPFMVPPNGIYIIPYTFTNPLYFVGAQFMTARYDNPNELYEGSISERQSEPFQTGNCLYPTYCFPPPLSSYLSGPGVQSYLISPTPGMIVMDHLVLSSFTQCTPPPVNFGEQTIHTFSADFSAIINFQNPLLQNPIYGTATVTIKMTKAAPVGNSENFNTEMLQLNLVALTDLGPLMIRESPTLLSSGQALITPVSGGYMISSFFDIFTEVSMDGGQTWTPAQQSGHITLPNCPIPSTIPTLSEWGLIIFGFVLICMGIYYIRKRRILTSYQLKQ